MSVLPEQKVWGTALHVFDSSNASVSMLTVVAGAYCSRHRHARRVNRFIVQSGAIDVVEYDDEGVTERARHRLRASEVYDVQAGVVHRFEVVESGFVVEVYFPAVPGGLVSQDDIERLDAGGRRN